MFTPLTPFVWYTDYAQVLSKYNLKKLKDIEELVADLVEVHIPFNNYITGFCAFTHKAGIHAKASKYLSVVQSASIVDAASSQQPIDI